MHILELTLGLVTLAVLVAAGAERVGVPAPPLLVAAGVAVGYLPGVPAVRVSPQLVLLVVLPPLLYAAGQDIDIDVLARLWPQVGALSIGLVLASAAAVTGVAVATLGLSGRVALVLGAVLASTDPVAVTALGRRLRLPDRVRTLVQAESLFNDATSLVLFTLVLGLVTGHGTTAGALSVRAVRLALGGIAIGAAAGLVVRLVRPRLAVPSVAAAAELVAPYACYVAAQAAGCSGVSAVVVAAVVVGGTAPGGAALGRLRTAAVSNTVVFLLESSVFALIGLQLPTLVRSYPQGAWSWLGPTLLLAALLVSVRGLWVLGTELVAGGRRRRRGRAADSSWAAAAVASWAGTRGVVPLAAALSIPLTTARGAPFPDRDLLLLVATSVVVITLLAQGLSLGPLVRRSGLAGPAPGDRGPAQSSAAVPDADALVALAQAALARLDELDRAGEVAPEVAARLRRRAERQLAAHRLELDPAAAGTRPDAAALAEGDARAQLRAAQRAELARLRRDGSVSERVRRQLERLLDLDELAGPPR